MHILGPRLICITDNIIKDFMSTVLKALVLWRVTMGYQKWLIKNCVTSFMDDPRKYLLLVRFLLLHQQVKPPRPQRLLVPQQLEPVVAEVHVQRPTVDYPKKCSFENKFLSIYQFHLFIRGQFHQRSTRSLYVHKFLEQLFCAYILGLYFTGARLLAQKLRVECWWNWALDPSWFDHWIIIFRTT